MPAESLAAVAALLAKARRYLQTVVAAVPDAEILPALALFGQAGASNIHYPGSAPLLNVYEEPHDGDFDFVKIRYPYRVGFAATNFKTNADWLEMAPTQFPSLRRPELLVFFPYGRSIYCFTFTHRLPYHPFQPR